MKLYQITICTALFGVLGLLFPSVFAVQAQPQANSQGWVKVDLLHEKNAPYMRKGSEMIKLILEGIKAQEIQPYQFSWTGLKREKVTLPWFYKATTNDDTKEPYTLQQLALIYLVKVKDQNNQPRIYKVSLAIRKGASSQISLGNVFYLDLDFEELIRFFEAKFKENPMKYGWINPANAQESMSYATALSQGKYWGEVDKTLRK
ncbi:MAG TPA: hypothetical protein DCS93_25360 [Microscillaceae bacterium]|nr:hypothetical protein [Microscillaceae bacterium]